MIAEIKRITETKDMKRHHDKREGANFFTKKIIYNFFRKKLKLNYRVQRGEGKSTDDRLRYREYRKRSYNAGTIIRETMGRVFES